MSNISSFPTAVPDGDDLILGSQIDVAGTPHTKNFTVQSIVNKVPSIQLGYTSLVQLLNRTGGVAPVATEVYNNTGETFTWSYVSFATYRLTSSSDIFTINKTIVFMNRGNLPTGSTTGWTRVNDNAIEIYSADNFVNASFEVKIYN